MAAHRTARARAREQITADIIEEARRQLAVDGAAGLSLRSVARELGMVSSAVYRYVASRDELLTRLIVEAYDAVGSVAEAAAGADVSPAERWVGVAHAIRDWALTHPHEYALVYGSPVPGYAAPATTSDSGTRVSLALVGVVAEAAGAGQLRRGPLPSSVVTAPLAADFVALRTNIDLDVDDDTVLDVLIAWTQIFGLLSFELFNQTRGVVTHHRDMYDACARRMAGEIGLS